AGVAETEQFGGLVEGLADGVVYGGAEPHIIADAAHGDDLRVAAGSKKQAIRKLGGVGEPRGERMRFQMIDRNQRLALYQRNRFRGGQPDDHAADQPGAGSGGDAIDHVVATIGLAHGLADDEVEHLDMGAGGNLWHHAAESGMLADLRQYDIGQDLAASVVGTLDHSGRSLVTGRLDAENDHIFLRPSLLQGV